jgi:hypothetical protein
VGLCNNHLILQLLGKLVRFGWIDLYLRGETMCVRWNVKDAKRGKVSKVIVISNGVGLFSSRLDDLAYVSTSNTSWFR